MEHQRTWNIVVFSILAAGGGAFIAVWFLDFQMFRAGVCVATQSSGELYNLSPWECVRNWAGALSGWVAAIAALIAAFYAGHQVKKQIDEANKTNRIASNEFLAKSYAWLYVEKKRFEKFKRCQAIDKYLLEVTNKMAEEAESVVHSNGYDGPDDSTARDIVDRYKKEITFNTNTIGEEDRTNSAMFIEGSLFDIRSEFISAWNEEREICKPLIERSNFVIKKPESCDLEKVPEEIGDITKEINKEEEIKRIFEKRKKLSDQYFDSVSNQLFTVDQALSQIRTVMRDVNVAT